MLFQGVAGCGKLFFEVTKGLNGQFHSCAEEFLPFLFESLTNENVSQEVLFQILEEYISNIALNVQPSKSTVLWTSLNAAIKNEIKQLDELNSQIKNKNLQFLLHLLGQCIEYKNGKLLQNSVEVLDILKKLMGHQNASEELVQTIVKIGIVILLSPNIKLPQDHSTAFVRQILSLNFKNVFLYFVEHISDYGSFEALILPVFLNNCVESDLDKESLHILTKLILKKSPLCFNGIKWATWKKYAINFRANQSTSIYTKFMEFLNLNNLDLDNYLCAVICLPHLNLANANTFAEKLRENIKTLCEKLGEFEIDLNMHGANLFLLHTTLEAALHLDVNLLEFREIIIETVLPKCSDISLMSAINMLDMYLTVCKDESIITLDLLRKMNCVLEANFDSPYHKVSTTLNYNFADKILDSILKTEVL